MSVEEICVLLDKPLSRGLKSNCGKGEWNVPFPQSCSLAYGLQVPKTDYLSNGLINHVLRFESSVALPRPAEVFVALFTTTPTKTGGGVEVSGGGYARVPLTLGAPTGGIASSVGDIVFPDVTVAWGVVGHFGIFDAGSGGNLLYFSPLAEPRQPEPGERFVIPAGSLTLVEF